METYNWVLTCECQRFFTLISLVPRHFLIEKNMGVDPGLYTDRLQIKHVQGYLGRMHSTVSKLER